MKNCFKHYFQQQDKTKTRNAFANSMSKDIKRSKAQLSKIILSDGFLWALLTKFAGPLIKVAVPLAKYILAPLAPMASASVTDSAIQRYICRRGVLRARKGITLVISNEDTVDMEYYLM